MINSQSILNHGSPLRVTQVSASLDKKLGGPVSVVKHVSRLLEQNFRHELIVFGTQHETIQTAFSVPTFRQNRYGFFFGRVNNLTRTQIRNSDIVLVHGYYLYSTLVTIALAKNCRIFVMPHGSLELYQKNIGRFRKMIFDVFFRCLAFSRNIAFIVSSSDEVIGVRDKFKKIPVHVLGLGIEKVSENYLRKNGLQEPIKLLSLSRIAEKKRIDLSIEAVRVLRDDGIDARLTIAGVGSQLLVKELRSLVNLYNLNLVVDFIGFVDDKDKDSVYMNADIFLLPSENENFAVAVAESIGRQVPVIVSNRVAMHRFVESHRTGLVIDKLDVNTLVTAILKVISNHSIYWQGCVKSRHLLTWDHVFEEWKRVLLATDEMRK
jgi:glycosyltransferase involved in cell wall biosynthesis